MCQGRGFSCQLRLTHVACRVSMLQWQAHHGRFIIGNCPYATPHHLAADARRVSSQESTVRCHMRLHDLHCSQAAGFSDNRALPSGCTGCSPAQQGTLLVQSHTCPRALACKGTRAGAWSWLRGEAGRDCTRSDAVPRGCTSRLQRRRRSAFGGGQSGMRLCRHMQEPCCWHRTMARE